LCLAIPDRRYTFDIRRPVSLPGEMIEAYLQKRKRPSLRQVFDAAALSKNSQGDERWVAGETVVGLPEEVRNRLVSAKVLVGDLSNNDSYLDAHCWIFTPSSFLDMAECLHIMGYFPYRMAAFFPTEPGSIEFIARLESCTESAEIVASIASCRDQLAALELGRTRSESHRTPVASDVGALEASLERMTAQSRGDAEQIDQLARQVASLSRDIELIRNSRSWKLTYPLRRLVDLIKH
jgi:hypothetical protein